MTHVGRLAVRILLAAALTIPLSSVAALGTPALHREVGSSLAHVRRTSAGRPLSRTVIDRVRPVDAQGRLRGGYTVVRRLAHASCQAGSEATGSAYRCFAGHFVVDPCWVTAHRDFVDCLAAGWRHTVWRLHVTKRYDNTGYTGAAGGRGAYPWGIALANHTRWGWLQGATGTVGKARIDYGRRSSRTVLIGGVDRRDPVWTIGRARNAGHYHYRRDGRVRIRRVWYGEPSLKG